MDPLEAIMSRRSIRSFTPDPVTDAELETVLRAAMAAPSAGNERPWRFVVVRDPLTLGELSRATPFAGPLAGAPVGLVVAADKGVLRYPGFWVIDCAAAIENLLLAARATGLGGVWIGVHPVEQLVKAVRNVIDMPGHVIPHSMVALGHPAVQPAPVDRYDPGFVHYDRW